LNAATVRVINRFVKIKVPVKEHESHVVNSFSLVSLSSVKESFVSSDDIGVSQEGSTKLCCNFAQVVSSTFTLEQLVVRDKKILVELHENWVSFINLEGKVLTELLKHLLQNLKFHFMNSCKDL